MKPTLKNVTTNSARIKRITESIIGLPTLPTIVSKMLELVDSPRTSAATLARLISADQALTAKILKLANSAYYGFSREISTVNMAIVVLGFNVVKEMGLSLSVFNVFKASEKSADFDVALFWEHSVGCGVAARMLARNYRTHFVGEAFVAGLLHDVGKVILKQYFDKELSEIITLQRQKNMTLEEAEIAVLEVSHVQIGAWLAEKWNLPQIISETVLLHHAPWKAKIEPLFVACICLADYICHLSKVGSSGRLALPLLDPQVFLVFANAGIQLDESFLPALQTEFLLEFDKSETFLSVIHE